MNYCHIISALIRQRNRARLFCILCRSGPDRSDCLLQKYIPEVTQGDIRVMTLGDKILPYAIKKLPTKDDFKFNTHNDDFIVASGLTKSDLDKFTPVAEKLNSMGIKMAGLDVINGKIIEVNVTSPCYFIKEVNNLYNVHLEDEICDFLLTKNLLSL